jgi:uncharacterized protein
MIIFNKLTLGVVTFVSSILMLSALSFFFNRHLPTSYVFYFSLLSKITLIIISVKLINSEKIIDKVYLYKNNLINITLSFLIILLVFDINDNLILKHNLQSNNINKILSFANCLLTGFLEELVFRVLFFSYLSCLLVNKSSRIFKSVFLTSILFSICHFTNILHDNIYNVINQMIFAFVIGFFLQLFFLRLRNIIIISVFHGILNYANMIQNNSKNVANNNLEKFNSPSNFLFILFIIIIIIFGFLIFKYLKNSDCPLVICDNNELDYS